jgi:hypothetical protein
MMDRQKVYPIFYPPDFNRIMFKAMGHRDKLEGTSLADKPVT